MTLFHIEENVQSFYYENRTPNNQFSDSWWTVTFTPKNDHTVINIVHENEADVQQILDMGFKEGYPGTVMDLSRYCYSIISYLIR